MVLLVLGLGLRVTREPRLQIALDELVFQTAGLELLVDKEQLIAQEPIIDIADDGGQSRRQGQLEGNDLRRH